MTVIAWTFALLAAATYLLVFVGEALLFRRPSVHQGIFFVPTADVAAVQLWAFGVGFYNLFLACGAIAGVIAWGAGARRSGGRWSSTPAWSCSSEVLCSLSTTGWR